MHGEHSDCAFARPRAKTTRSSGYSLHIFPWCRSPPGAPSSKTYATMRMKTNHTNVLGGRAVWKAFAAAGWLSIVILSLLPGTERPHTGAPGIYEHFLAYLLVAICAGMGLALKGRLAAMLFLGLTAAILEVAQIHIPGRTADFAGFASALSGAAAALLVLAVMDRLPQGNS